VFTPTEIKGGLVYLPGAAVDARAYFPIAFEIAARGHLVVVVEIQLRAAPSHIEEANKVIDSTLPLFAGKCTQNRHPPYPETVDADCRF
jgi:hypothetical protein